MRIKRLRIKGGKLKGIAGGMVHVLIMANLLEITHQTIGYSVNVVTPLLDMGIDWTQFIITQDANGCMYNFRVDNDEYVSMGVGADGCNIFPGVSPGMHMRSIQLGGGGDDGEETTFKLSIRPMSSNELVDHKGNVSKKDAYERKGGEMMNDGMG